VGLVGGTKVGRSDQSWLQRLDFEAKMASSHDGACPRDLLQALVAGTSALVCVPTLNLRVQIPPA